MPLNGDGFCTSCQRWALDFPGLACPWCASASADAARASLGLDPDADHVAVLVAVRAELEAIRAKQRQLMALRSRAARALLKAGNVADDVKAARTRLDAVERWAVADMPAAERERLAPNRMPGKRQLRIEYEERMRRREEAFQLARLDAIPERLRPSLGSRSGGPATSSRPSS